MTAAESVAEQVARLLEVGWLAKSKCSALLRQKLGPLLAAGVIVEDRFGAGRRLVVRDLAALRTFQLKEFPDCPLPADTATRVLGVARFRDSKTFPNDTPVIVSVRAWREDAFRKEGQPTEAAAATARHGAFCVLLENDSSYSVHGACALVENPIVFARFESLGLPVGLVFYGQGRISNRVLDWLGRTAGTDFTLLHLPDYDPAGLNEFERIRSRLGTRVRLHLPDHLSRAFEQFANRHLLESPNSQAMLAALRGLGSAETQQVLELIHRHNGGLEQEALLATPPSGRPARP